MLTSHTLQELSAEAVKRCRESGVTCRFQIDPLCPSYEPSRSPVSLLHTVAHLSLPEDQNRSPSALNVMHVSGRSWPCSRNGRNLVSESGWCAMPAAQKASAVLAQRRPIEGEHGAAARWRVLREGRRVSYVVCSLVVEVTMIALHSSSGHRVQLKPVARGGVRRRRRRDLIEKR